MSNLSAETLFHYTPRKSWLINILKKGISPRYSKELDATMGDELTLGGNLYVPMSCFCDTPLSLASRHMSIYGSYGIGLTKSWGIKNNLNPIFYMNKENTVNYNLVTSIHNAIVRLSQENNTEKLQQDLVYIYKYIKPYKCGTVYRKGKSSIPGYVYYNEKEWRYVPDNLSDDQKIFLNTDKISLARANDNLKSRSLVFEAKDIKYIIVRTSKDVNDILQAIKVSKLFKQEDKQHLTTTLITAEQIRKDF